MTNYEATLIALDETFDDWDDNFCVVCEKLIKKATFGEFCSGYCYNEFIKICQERSSQSFFNGVEK